MPTKKMRAARANGTALEKCFAITPSSFGYSSHEHARQAPFDVVSILASRARVALPTARLFAELNGIGGVHG